MVSKCLLFSAVTAYGPAVCLYLCVYIQVFPERAGIVMTSRLSQSHMKCLLCINSHDLSSLGQTVWHSSEQGYSLLSISLEGKQSERDAEANRAERAFNWMTSTAHFSTGTELHPAKLYLTLPQHAGLRNNIFSSLEIIFLFLLHQIRAAVIISWALDKTVITAPT